MYTIGYTDVEPWLIMELTSEIFITHHLLSHWKQQASNWGVYDSPNLKTTSNIIEPHQCESSPPSKAMLSAAATKLWVSRQRVKCNKPNNENRPNITPTNPIPHTQLHTHHFEPLQFPVIPLTLDPVPVSIPCSLDIAITPEILQLSMSQKVHRLMQKAKINKNSKNNSRQHPSS